MSVLVTAAMVKDTLASAPFEGKHLLEPLRALALQSCLPLNILEDHNVWNDAEIHMHEDDLWYCLEGEVDFIYGGEMVDPWVKTNKDGSKDEREIKSKEIKGGTKVTLRPGDWLYIPAGEPHQHGVREGTGRLVIIKIPKQSA